MLQFVYSIYRFLNHPEKDVFLLSLTLTSSGKLISVIVHTFVSLLQNIMSALLRLESNRSFSRNISPVCFHIMKMYSIQNIVTYIFMSGTIFCTDYPA